MSDIKPYPGLRPFERHESKVFFGRQDQISDLLQILKNNKLLMILGSSSSGKSSLVKAGLLPALEKGYMGKVGTLWKMIQLSPGSDPFQSLAECFCQQMDLEESKQTIAMQLKEGARSIQKLLEQKPLRKRERLLIVIDQFEEIFRYRQIKHNEASAFVTMLLEAQQHPDIYVVITMRSDFLGEATTFRGFPETLNRGIYLIPRMTREQLSEAISLPARLFNGEVEGALVNRLLNESENSPDQLPLLQHTLMQLWLVSEDNKLTLANYKNLNGLKGALDAQLEGIYKNLKAEQQYICESLFRALTERGVDGKIVRRPIIASEILDIARCNIKDLEKVISHFQGEGKHFLVTSTIDLKKKTILDISHESLIRQWKRLKHWIKEETEKVKEYRQLVDRTTRYSEKRGELLSGMDLDLAIAWLSKTRPSRSWAERYQDNKEDKYQQVMQFIDDSAKRL